MKTVILKFGFKKKLKIVGSGHKNYPSLFSSPGNSIQKLPKSLRVAEDPAQAPHLSFSFLEKGGS